MAVEVAPVGVLEDGTVFYAPLGEVLHDGDDLVCCHLCGRWLRQVGGTHLRVGHGWTLAEYREAFRLLQSTPTCSRDLSAGLRRHAQARLGQKGFGTPPSALSARMVVDIRPPSRAPVGVSGRGRSCRRWRVRRAGRV